MPFERMPGWLLLGAVLHIAGLASANLVPPHVHIAVVMAETGEGLSPCDISAVRMAVDEVNADASILPDTVIEASYHDTRSSTPYTQLSMMEALCAFAGQSDEFAGRGTDLRRDFDFDGEDEQPLEEQVCVPAGCERADIILGATYSANSIAAAHLAALAKVPMVSSSSGSPHLSDKSEFPTFSRLISSVHDASGFAFALRYFGWSRVNVMRTLDEPFNGIASTFGHFAREIGIEISGDFVFGGGAVGDVDDSLQGIEETGTFIIILFGPPDEMVDLIEAAVNRGFGVPPWVIISASSFDTDEQRARLPDGLMILDPNAFDPTREPYLEFLERWRARPAELMCSSYLMSDPDIFPTNAYDTVHVVARALDEVLHNTTEGAAWDTSAIVDAIRNVQYDEGASGPVRLDAVGDRLMPMQLMNIMDGQEVPKGLLTSRRVLAGEAEADGWEIRIDDPLVFFGGSTDIPPDSAVLTPWEMSAAVRGFAAGLSIFGVVITVLTAAGILYYRKERVIRWSSPVFCLCVCCGFGLACVGQVIDAFLADGGMTAVACNTITWLELVGSVLAFAALFAKTYRVHKIFNNATLKKIKITDRDLAPIVCGVTGAVVLYLTVWVATVPLKPVEVTTPPDSDGVQSTFVECISGGEDLDDDAAADAREETLLWLGAFFFLLGLLVWGAALAWATRTVPAGFNESRYVGITIYNALLCGLLVTPMTVVLRENPEVAMILVSFRTVWPCVFGVIVLFGPKFAAIRAGLEVTMDARTAKPASAGSVGLSSGSSRSFARGGSAVGAKRSVSAGPRVRPPSQAQRETLVRESSVRANPLTRVEEGAAGK